MKKLDHTEFIQRHHNHKKKKKLVSNRRSLNAAVIVSVLVLYFVLMIFVVHMASVDTATVAISLLVFLITTIVAFAARRAQYLQARQEKELILLKEVLEGSRGGRMITDSADNVRYYNQKFCEMCPSEDGEYSFDAFVEMFSGNNQASVHFNTLSDYAHRGLTDSIELYCDKQDSEGWYHITAQPVAGHAGFIHWRLDNVTDKYTADRAVREEREKLIDFTDNAPVGFFSLDENGRFVFANATLARWLGDDLNYILEHGTLHRYFMHEIEGAEPFDIMSGGSDKQVAEVEMKGAGGRSFLASINQSIVRGADGSVRTRAVVHDLTSEREMTQKLQASEDRFKRFYEEAPLGIVLVNKDGLIEDCNSQFARMVGKNQTDLEKKHFKLLISDEHRDAVLSTMRQMHDGQGSSESMEVTLYGDKQGLVSAQFHARRFSDGGSTVLHFIDITEKKSLEEQFVQSQKMQAVGQLAGGIAHDFNNLLTAIIGFCDLLLLRHKAGDPSFGDIMQIKQNSNRAANLVRQLLAFSRQQTLRPKVHDVTDILTELSHLMRRLIGANIDLEMMHGSDLGLVKVDEGQMEQVLINLAVNARDAMDGGGKLTIETENFTNRQAKEVIEETIPPGHWTLIKVSDTGCGIPKENMKRILEPFFTTKGVGEGTGLGLATVYGIIRQTGGYLDIQSEVGVGTTFFIYLPRANEADEEVEDAPEEKAKPIAKDLTGTERILLVEDEDAVRTFSQRALVNKGYEVLAAEDGEDALSIFNEEGNKDIDLLVTDVVMPGMDGPTLAQRIRQANPELKIIFMSGYTEDKLKDYMGENIYFLPKPFTLKVLAEKVKEVLSE